MIKLGPINLAFNNEITKLKTEVVKLYDSITAKNTRTGLDAYRTTSEPIQIPYFPISLYLLYDLSDYSDVLRTIHFNLKKEIFRNGHEVKEKFANKCTNPECLKEFENPVDKCDECGGTELREPDSNEKKQLEKFLKKVNDNDQDIIEVSEQINDDLEIIDNAYLHCLKEYTWGPSGDILSSQVKEVLRAETKYMYIVADRTGRRGYNEKGQRLMFCVDHRDKMHIAIDRCPQCGKQMLPACYMTGRDGYTGTMYYSKDEILHLSKYKPSLTYGTPLTIAVWLKVVTLMNQDVYIEKYYAKQRPPRGLMFVRTANADSLEKAWKWALDMFKKNPHMIPPISVEDTGSGSNFVEFVDFMRSLDEMQFTEYRNEAWQKIGAAFGIMPLFHADLSNSGGLNNEGLEITVTNRAIEFGQRIYNKKAYPWLCKQFGIKDYEILLNPSEEQDEMADEQLMGQKILNAQNMQSMGYDCILNEEGDFEFEPTEVPVEKPEPVFSSPFGGDDTAPKPKPTNPPTTGASPAGAANSSQRQTGEPKLTKNIIHKVNKLTKEVKKIKKKTKDAYHV